MCDPMQHGQSQPYSSIIPPQGETKFQNVAPPRETMSKGDGFCRGLLVLLLLPRYLLLGMEDPCKCHFAPALLVRLTQVIFWVPISM
ncbi:hypothetical protein SDJN03_16182, partial [Cucurbita argyrosperma subsp. sororia]